MHNPCVEDLGSRVAVNSERIRTLAAETERLRTRVHALEGDRATLKLLGSQVRELTEQMPNLARRAAREAVEEFDRIHHAGLLANLRTYAMMVSAGVALGAL